MLSNVARPNINPYWVYQVYEPLALPGLPNYTQAHSNRWYGGTRNSSQRTFRCDGIPRHKEGAISPIQSLINLPMRIGGHIPIKCIKWGINGVHIPLKSHSMAESLRTPPKLAPERSARGTSLAPPPVKSWHPADARRPTGWEWFRPPIYGWLVV